jgi:hypothetical protein
MTVGFLRALFADIPGCTEVRVIEDKKGGHVVDRRWHSTVDALVADLPRLNALAAERSAGIFFGVLPRRPRGGKKEDTFPGLVAWLDLDFKDFPGGEAEARTRLRGFPLEPSIVVRSGHGLHAYWILKEPTEPAILECLSKGLAKALGGDHAFDAARILRLPGTMNRKDPANPVPVEVDVLEASRTYNASDIQDALTLVGVVPEAVASVPAESAGAEVAIADEISPRVLALIDNQPRIRGLFTGHGKPGVGEDGKSLDVSSSGYDFSLALALAKRGIQDPSEIATAIWHRPDRAAQAKGLGYVTRTVLRALERARGPKRPPRDDADRVDFVVERVRAFSSNPPIYEFTIDGKTFTASSTDLNSKRRFSVRFTDALRRIPKLMCTAVEWTDVVNGWLARAEPVELPPEASDEQALRMKIERIITDLMIVCGDTLEDLDAGKCVALDDGRKAFKTDAIRRAIKEDEPELKPNQICRILRAFGYEHGPHRFQGAVVRAWTNPSESRAQENEK